jgi:Asp/Glu/hydantoin racemase
MRLKIIPPVKEMDILPGEISMARRMLLEIESEGLLKDIEWDLDEGVPGPWVENREELAQVVPGILKLVREACESRKYDAIIILGGLDPGLYAAKEIGVGFGVPVVGATHSEVVFAYALGNKFSVIDVLDCMAITIRQNIMSYGMNEKCASVRSIEWSLKDLGKKPPKAAVDAFIQECIEAIEKDGADVIVCGCSCTLPMQPLVQRRLIELGYHVPVLHAYKCAIEIAKALVHMRVFQSKFAFPSRIPKPKAMRR